MLEQLIVIIHIIAAVAVVGLILLQHGKGADMGASFGSGASQTVLGVQGGGNLLTHSTAILATVFFVTSLSLGYFAKQKTVIDSEDIIIENVAAQPLDDEIPAGDAAVVAEDIPAQAEATVQSGAATADGQPDMVENKTETQEIPE